MNNPQPKRADYLAPTGAVERQALSTGVGADGEEYLISLRDFRQVLRKRIFFIMVVALLLVGAALAFSLQQTPMYQGSIKLWVGQERGKTENPADVLQLQQLTQTMAEGVNSRSVAEEVIRKLGLSITSENFLQHLGVKQIPQTQFVQVGFEDPSPERARQVANTVGDVFSEQVSQASPTASAITVSVWERAQTPDKPVSPKPMRTVLLALGLGLVLGVGLAFLIEYWDDKWRSPEEVEQITGVPTFGVIPEFESATSGKKGGL